MKLKLLLYAILISVLFTACEKKEILPGKRELIPGIAADNSRDVLTPNLAKVALTRPSSIASSLYIAGNKEHNSINYKMNPNAKVLWKTSFGVGPISSDIIAFDDNIYVIDAHGTLFCVSQKDGQKIWKKSIAPQPRDGVFSGGLTANDSTIYVSTNTGNVIAIDSKTQEMLWTKSLKYPIRGAPLYIDEKLIITSIENQTFAVDAKTGDILWTKTANKEQTVMAEAGTPGVFGDSVICAYSSGDIFSLGLQDGNDNWNDVLLSSNVNESGVVISHIAASPVVYGDSVLAATSESKMSLLDAASGIRIWEQDIGTLTPPVINGGVIFVLSDNSVFCMSLENGSINWKCELSAVYNRKDVKPSSLNWRGPLIINSDIIVFSDAGDLIRIDASTGKLKKHDLIKDAAITRTPLVVNEKMFAVTSRAEIYAFG
ncbi:MAG: PQQ-like beta-propeller repeat protein [Holosporales bacterium]|jgi:outer membrane protein assembly factor BamB|nr:PQQ-like beta-propeller repeat protein [Holosporales bacterium]